MTRVASNRAAIGDQSLEQKHIELARRLRERDVPHGIVDIGPQAEVSHAGIGRDALAGGPRDPLRTHWPDWAYWTGRISTALWTGWPRRALRAGWTLRTCRPNTPRWSLGPSVVPLDPGRPALAGCRSGRHHEVPVLEDATVVDS